jgi:peptide/nickel transport system substrate-binding protein
MGGQRRARRLAACAVPILAVALGACGGKDDDAAKAPVDISKEANVSATTPAPTGDVDRVTWALGAEPASLDWVYGYDYPPNTVLANLCESLLRIGPDFAVEPNLAESFENPDPKTWVYKLRSGVQFHSGGEMTADDVVFSLKRHMDPDVGSYWTTAFTNVASIEKTGDLEVTVRLKRPDALFNQMMAVPPGVVESKAAVQSAGKDYGGPQKGVDCTGPFEFGKWDKGQSVTLDRFDGYWDAERKAHAAQLEIDFISDATARVNAVLSGAVDGTYALPASAVEKVERAGIGTVFRGPQTSTMNLIVGDLDGPLGKVEIRKALSLAIDRDGFLAAAIGGRGEPSRAVAAKLTWGTGPARDVYAAAWDALGEPAQDVEAAKQLVADAGAPSEPVVIAVSSGDPVQQVIANEVQAAGKRIGVPVEIKPVPPDSYGALFGDASARKGVDLFWTTWYADIADALQIYQNWESKSFANYAGWKDPAYDGLIADALTEPDPVKRAEIVVKAQEIVSDQLPWIPIAQANNTAYMNKRITGAPASNAYLYYPWGAEVGAAG